MKNIYCLLLLAINSSFYSQQATTLNVQDTRWDNNPPASYNNELKAEFKLKSVVGFPDLNTYSGMLTLAPWSDDSGGKVHQMNFNADGIFYRNAFQSEQWGGWNKMLMQDVNGNVGIGKQPALARLDIAGDIASTGNITGSDLVSGGSNAWKFHTPDDGRSTLFVAPLLADGNGDWAVATEFKAGNIAVKGKLEAREIKVTQSPTADFVFAEDYNLPKLEDVEKHIKENKHLPEIASAKEMEKDGVNVGEFQIKLLQKIEELTLYSIEQNKQLQIQSEKIEKLEKVISGKNIKSYEN